MPVPYYAYFLPKRRHKSLLLKEVLVLLPHGAMADQTQKCIFLNNFDHKQQQAHETVPNFYCEWLRYLRLEVAQNCSENLHGPMWPANKL
jgi:hypothetical protein